MVFDLSYFWWRLNHSLEAWPKEARLRDGPPNGQFVPLEKKNVANLLALLIGFFVKPVADGSIANVSMWTARRPATMTLYSSVKNAYPRRRR